MVSLRSGETAGKLYCTNRPLWAVVVVVIDVGVGLWLLQEDPTSSQGCHDYFNSAHLHWFHIRVYPRQACAECVRS